VRHLPRYTQSMADNELSFDLLWSAFTGYQRTAAIKAAIELDVFTVIGEGATTLDAIARQCESSPRGMRILLDHLTMDGFLARDGDRYRLSPTAAALLDRNAPAYVGSAITFIASPYVRQGFDRLTDAVKQGGSVVTEGSMTPEHPMWVEFARAMAPLAGMSALLLANLLEVERATRLRVLDVAAGHGLFGITVARLNPAAEVTGLDWANVLGVAAENARLAGVAERWRALPGSALEVELGGPYDLVLLPNILHHFDAATCERLLARAHGALVPGGRVAIVEFVPDEDRQGPPDAVRFGLVMLAGTPGGDVYTFGEYQRMLKNAGLRDATLHDLAPTPARVVVAVR
jgi:SAM-dependent methyltransferase